MEVNSECTLQKFIPYRYDARPGEVYARREKRWVLVGIIKQEDKPYGFVTPVDAEEP